jgi:hypothetical protein
MKSHLLKVAAALPPGFCDNCKSISCMVFTDELDIKLEQPTTTLFGLVWFDSVYHHYEGGHDRP